MRKFQQAHVDGNAADVERCSGIAANPLFNTLCLENDGFSEPQPPANFQILTPATSPIKCPPGHRATPARPRRRARSTAPAPTHSLTGDSLQATNDDKIFGHDNYFTLGGSIDHSKIRFSGQQRAWLHLSPTCSSAPMPPSRRVDRSSTPPANIGFSPVSLDAQNTYYGFYANETFDVTDRLVADRGRTLQPCQDRRWRICLAPAPIINGNYTFSRFNPVVGLTYKILPEMTFYTGYSEANRAPTPLELGCSNPPKPCLLEGFLVSDPPLQQVVARTREAGLRGNVKVNGGGLDWKLGLFRTDSKNDIIQVASIIQGRGVFQNVPGTRRQGVEAGAQYQAAPWLFYANYASSMPPISSPASSLRPTIRRRMRTEISSSRRQPHSRYPATPDQDRRRLSRSHRL